MRKSPNGLAHTFRLKRGKTFSVHFSLGISGKKKIQNFISIIFLVYFFRLELVTGALQKYRNVVRQKNVIKYDPIYPIISSYLENVYKNL